MTPPIGISYSSSSTTSASAAPIFVASGTTYDMLVHTQDFVFQYKLVTYGQSTSGLWPPEGLCTTVSAYQFYHNRFTMVGTQTNIPSFIVQRQL